MILRLIDRALRKRFCAFRTIVSARHRKGGFHFSVPKQSDASVRSDGLPDIRRSPFTDGDEKRVDTVSAFPVKTSESTNTVSFQTTIGARRVIDE